MTRDQVDLKVLRTLSDWGVSMTGYDIQRSSKLKGFRVFPSLRRLLHREYVTSEWLEDPIDPQRLYRITARGRNRLQELLDK